MLTTRSRSLIAIAAGALLLAPLAGCGSEDKTSDASAKTTASASSSPSSSTSATTSGDDSSDSGAASGGRLTTDNLVATMVAAMREKKTAHMVMELGSSMDATADLRYSDSGTEMTMQMTMGGTKATVILVGGVMYIQQAAGGKFVKIDKSDPSMGNLLEQMSSMGPEASVKAMKNGLKKVQYAGTETVDGDTLSKYDVTVDTAAVTKALGAAAASADLPKTVTYKLYVDGDNLMRRVDMQVSGQKIVMKVSDWGKPVVIKAPPASQIQTR
jgi:hypothetical protein